MANQRDTIVLNYLPSIVLSAAVSALEANGAEIKNIDNETHRISAKRGTSIWSWGENIDVEITEIGQGQSVVRISSRERMPLQVIDWGKNAKNIDDFEAELRVRLEGSAEPS